jgi:hypothetical protein
MSLKTEDQEMNGQQIDTYRNLLQRLGYVSRNTQNPSLTFCSPPGGFRYRSIPRSSSKFFHYPLRIYHWSMQLDLKFDNQAVDRQL